MARHAKADCARGARQRETLADRVRFRANGLIAILASAMLAAGLLFGCSSSGAEGSVANRSSSSDVAASVVQPARQGSESVQPSSSQQDQLADSSIPDGWQTWDEAAAPNYVLVVGSAVERYDVDEGSIFYDGFDSLGRTQYVAASLTPQMRAEAKARGRQSLDEHDNPSGWTTDTKTSIVQPNGKVYNGYFWNRSHLVADSLDGAPARKNLVTGTRMQNVGANDGRGGMAYTETKARDWLDSHSDGTLYYAATPLYADDELIPRAVLVDMRSSDGVLDEEVIVYNAAKGFSIDYATGAYQATEAAATQTSAESATDADVDAAEQAVYVSASGKGKKYHLDSACRGLNGAATTELSQAEAVSEGYGPCGICAR